MYLHKDDNCKKQNYIEPVKYITIRDNSPTDKPIVIITSASGIFRSARIFSKVSTLNS